MRAEASNPRVELAVTASVVGWGVVQVTAEQIPALRKAPGVWHEKIAPTALKQADEQTVVAVAAVLQAAQRGELVDFASWGILAAPLYFGRSVTLASLLAFEKEGAWGVSPHLIPHHSLHAISGTLSQLLHIHGPNLGVGNGPGATYEAFLLAGAMMSDLNLPGLWIVLTEHDAEPIPGQPMPGCLGVALALRLQGNGAESMQLRVCPGEEEHVEFLASLPEFSLTSFAQELERTDGDPAGMWRLGPRGWLEIESGESR